MILVQHIAVHWTKRSRGAPRASRRSAVPSAVPVVLERSDSWILHEVRFHESSDFRQKIERQIAIHSDDERPRGLVLTSFEDGVRVGFRWDDTFGAPPRSDRVCAFALMEGDYGRVMINGRHALESTHAYSLHTFNITLAEIPTEDTFTGRQPDHLLDLRAELF